MKDYNRLKLDVITMLKQMKFYPDYKDEEHELQPHLKSVIDELLSMQYPGLQSIRSIGEDENGRAQKKPSLRLFGASYWPDIEIKGENGPIIGIEVKYVKTGVSATSAIAEAIGQALIYRLRYEVVIVLVIHNGKYDSRYNDYDARFADFMERIGIDFILRRPS